MTDMSQWKRYWDGQGRRAASDYEYDRGTAQRTNEIENLSTQELLEFIDPQPTDVVFDAGCGTGVNIFLLHSKVRRIVGVDYSHNAVVRCRRRLDTHSIANADLMQADVTHLPLPDGYADRILCMSVLQYLNPDEVRIAFAEFARVLQDRGILILHVKNLASLYLSTLWLAKRLLVLFGRQPKFEYFRPYGWYAKGLEAAGFTVAHYNSFHFFKIEFMPQRLAWFLQKVELRHYQKFPFRTGPIRRHGSELKIRACLRKKT